MKYSLIVVDWKDSAGGQGWCDLKTVTNSPKVVICKSVGYKIAETNECLVVASHLSYGSISGEVNQVQGDMVIPKVAIIKVTKIGTGENQRGQHNN